MISQRQILEFLAKHTGDFRSISYEDLETEFNLHPVAATDHLRRLWRERLIDAVPARPRGFRYRLLPGESFRRLRFRLGSRGRKRLNWYQRHEKPDWFEEFFGLKD
jgi:hypothetical protein